MKKLLAIFVILVLSLSVCSFAFAESEVICVAPLQMRTTATVNVRKWAGLDAPVQTVLDKDTTIEVWGFSPAPDGRIWCEHSI